MVEERMTLPPGIFMSSAMLQLPLPIFGLLKLCFSLIKVLRSLASKGYEHGHLGNRIAWKSSILKWFCFLCDGTRLCSLARLTI
jgi:hypothetical protein